MEAVTLRTHRLLVMEKLGMARDPGGDFDHPDFPPGHPLGPHVLYRIRSPGSARIQFPGGLP